MFTFFSFPPEVRDMIYDILHQHEQNLDNGRMTFVFPLTHVRNISREFRGEYDSRLPATSRLVVSQENWCWGKFTASRHDKSRRPLSFSGALNGSAENKKLPQRLPKLVTQGRVTSYTDLEFNLDVYDEVRRQHDFSPAFKTYSTWISNVLYREHHLPRVSCGGEVHLRLFFSYVSTFNYLKGMVTKKTWFSAQCNKVSLVLYSGGDGIPNEDTLSRARVLAVWTKGDGWEVEEETIRSLRAELV